MTFKLVIIIKSTKYRFCYSLHIFINKIELYLLNLFPFYIVNKL